MAYPDEPSVSLHVSLKVEGETKLTEPEGEQNEKDPFLPVFGVGG